MEQSTSRLVTAILIPEIAVDALGIGIGCTEMLALVITPQSFVPGHTPPSNQNN